MTKTNLDNIELLQRLDQNELSGAIAASVLQLLSKADMEGLIGALRHEQGET